MKISEAILFELVQECESTGKVIERIPGELLDWQPHQKSRTMGQQAIHLVDIIDLLAIVLQKDEIEFNLAEYSPQTPQSTEEILKKFDESISRALETLDGKPDAFLLDTWKMKSGKSVIFEMPRAAFIRQMTINHSIHHRGQLVLCLRLNDIALPPIYGPTADSQL